MLDFHFSDNWADPAHQTKPVSWQNYSIPQLNHAVANYTAKVIDAFISHSIDISYIQVGNEIICGMLWPEGNVCQGASWEVLEGFLNASISVIRQKSSLTEIIIHTDKPLTWFFDHISHLDFDIIGVSYYPWWHGTLSDLNTSLVNFTTRYSQDLMVVETAYPFTLGWNDNINNIIGSPTQLHEGYSATPQGQRDFFKVLVGLVDNLPSDRGQGVLYWEPLWMVNSPWENLAFFDFEGNALAIASQITSSFSLITLSDPSTSFDHSTSEKTTSNNETVILIFFPVNLIILLIKSEKRNK